MARLGPAGGLQTVRYRRGKPWGPDALARCACVVDNQIVDLHIINIYQQGSAQLRKFAMPTFVLLNKLTPAGFEKIHQDPDRLDAVSTEIEKMGCKVVAQYALLGEYDFLTIVEAPDAATVAHMSVDLSARGTSTRVTIPAISAEEFKASLKGPNHLAR